jgi:hypothetical protein
MLAVAVLLLGFLSAAQAAPSHGSGCQPTTIDADAVADARADVASRCDCATAASHGAYTKCAKDVVHARVLAGQLSGSCAKFIARCNAKSTCGRPGAVTCCREVFVGAPSCTIKRDASKCTPPKGGTATIGTEPSCCDACPRKTSCTTTTGVPCGGPRPGSCPTGQQCQETGPGNFACVGPAVPCADAGGDPVCGLAAPCPAGMQCNAVFRDPPFFCEGSFCECQ